MAVKKITLDDDFGLHFRQNVLLTEIGNVRGKVVVRGGEEFIGMSMKILFESNEFKVSLGHSDRVYMSQNTI